MLQASDTNADLQMRKAAKQLTHTFFTTGKQYFEKKKHASFYQKGNNFSIFNMNPCLPTENIRWLQAVVE